MQFQILPILLHSKRNNQKLKLNKMSYISTQQVKEIRNELKKQFPTTKMSVTRRHHSGVQITILSSPIKLIDKKYQSVNHYYINETFQGPAAEVLSKINDIASTGVTYRETGDYGTQPSHYVTISIGDYERPFEHKA